MTQTGNVENTPLTRIQPAEKPPRFPVNIFKLLSNNLELIPQAAYLDPVTLVPGPPRMAIITGSEAVGQILQKDHSSYPRAKWQNDVLSPLFEQALISLEGDDWRWQRRLVAPLFQHKELLKYCGMMENSSAAIISDWRADRCGTPRDIHKDMLKAAFSVISRALLTGSADAVIKSLQESHAAYFHSVNWWVVYKLLHLPSWMPRPGRRAMEDHSRLLHESVREIVRRQRNSKTPGEDLLGKLLDARDPETGQPLSEDHIIDNIKGFIVGGFDTTALALAWTLYLLARFPDWEERILTEVTAAAGDEAIGSQHLDRLPLVRQFVSESLRLFPTAPVVLREIENDVELMGCKIPAGTIGLIPIYAIHRHHRNWSDPDRFDPNRFAADAPSKPDRYQYLPFGAGPRICIGASFAMMELVVMIASFVRSAKFHVPPGDEPKPVGQMFLTSRNGIRLQVELRSRDI